MNKRTTIIVVAVLLALLALILFGPRKVFKENIEYDIRNIVVNQTNHDYYEDIVNVGLNELCIEGEVVLIQFHRADEEIEGLDLRGAIFTNGQQYLINLYDLKQREAIEVIAHELIHLEQYRSKRLVGTKDTIFFEGVGYKKGQLPAYRKRPWEAEAFRRQVPLQKAIQDIVLEYKE